MRGLISGLVSGGLFLIIQLSLFSFSLSPTFHSISQMSVLAVFFNLVFIWGMSVTFRLIFRSDLIAYGVCFLLAALFSFINFQKLSLVGDVVTLYDLFSVFHFGLLIEYLRWRDGLFIAFFLIGIVALAWFLKSVKKNRKRHRKEKIAFKGKLGFSYLVTILFFFSLIFSSELRLDHILRRMKVGNSFWNPFYDYKTNGVVLSNVLGFRQSFIVPPREYSQKTIQKILAPFLSQTPKPLNKESVSVILYMMESLWDPQWLPVKLSEDPIPTFHWLQNEGSGGALVVPNFGGGTANTEFEVLTGMPLYFEPPGALPYVQYVRKPVPSLASYYKKSGFHTFAFHNYNRLYYKRFSTYPLFGFDEFFSVEKMKNYELHRGFPSDGALVNKIVEETGLAEAPFFVHAVSMESHGPYRFRSNLADRSKIKVLQSKLSASSNEQIENYVNALRSADQALRKLILALSKMKRRVVVVVFGDHLPALGENFEVYLESGLLSSTDPGEWTPEERLRVRTTPLAVWSNQPLALPPTLQTISSNCLGSRLLELVHAEPSAFFKFNASFCREMIVFSPGVILNHEFKFFSLDPLSIVTSWEDLPPLFRNYRSLVYDRLNGEGYSVQLENRQDSSL